MKVTGSGANINDLASELTEKTRTPKFKKLETDYLRLIGSIGMAVMLVSQQDGMTIISRTDGLVTALIDAAEKDARLCKVLEAMVVDSVYFALFVQVAGLGGALLSNHGINPVDKIKSIFSSKKEKKNDAANHNHDAVRVPFDRDFIASRLME